MKRAVLFLYNYPEVAVLALYVLMIAIAVAKGEWGKTTYWVGASILTIGILMMRG